MSEERGCGCGRDCSSAGGSARGSSHSLTRGSAHDCKCSSLERSKQFFDKERRLEKVRRGERLLFEPVPVKLLSKRREGSRHILLRLKAHTDYQPGQFFQVTVLGYGEAPISIASFSHERIDLLVNPVGSVTRELVRKKPGGKVLLRGPYGYGYPMDFFRNNSLVLIGGGCGVAPLKGVLEYVVAHRSCYHDVHCFFGYRAPEDAIFTKELSRWEDEGLLESTVAFSRPPAGFVGNTGFVTRYLESAGLDNGGRVALICGPTPMMLSAVKTLNALGWNDDQIWISHERHMKCATGMCGHCMIEGKYTCKDGPVFRWDWIKDAKG